MAAKLISTGLRHTTLPENYVRPLSDRPRLSEVSQLEDFPLIDLSSSDRSLLIQQLQQACARFGFFQVINHGVSKQITDDMVSVAHEFFSMSMEEKMKLYSDDPTRTTSLSTSFEVKKEEVNNWRDYLRLHCYPIHTYVHEWPSNPPSFKEKVSKYSREVREEGFLKIEKLISESLGLEKDCMKNVLGGHIAVNYYPPCLEPELTYDLPAHTDPNALTIFLQDTTVCALKILIDGQWFAVNPHPDAFLINIGDKLRMGAKLMISTDRRHTTLSENYVPPISDVERPNLENKVCLNYRNSGAPVGNNFPMAPVSTGKKEAATEIKDADNSASLFRRLVKLSKLYSSLLQPNEQSLIPLTAQTPPTPEEMQNRWEKFTKACHTVIKSLLFSVVMAIPGILTSSSQQKINVGSSDLVKEIFLVGVLLYILTFIICKGVDSVVWAAWFEIICISAGFFTIFLGISYLSFEASIVGGPLFAVVLIILIYRRFPIARR